MNYLDVYRSRLNFLGYTTGERILHGGERSFSRQLKQSPHAVYGLKTDKGYVFDGIILQSKDKTYEKIMYLQVSNFTDIHVGDIINQINEDAQPEKQLIFQKTKKNHASHDTYQIVRCNYELRQIDAENHIQVSQAYVVSSVDSKIKGNFRTQNSLITPQPNKYAEIMLPYYPIDLGTNFLIANELQTLVEDDHTSVPGIIYLSLTEGKVNTMTDDQINNLADTDRIADYRIDMPDEVQKFTVGELIKPMFTLMKDGTISDEPTRLLPNDKSYAHVQGNDLIADIVGETDIIVQLINHPEIVQVIHIEIVDAQTEDQKLLYIEGPDEVRLDRTATYELVSNDTTIGDVDFSLSNDLCAITSTEENTCMLRANAKNNLGLCILTATYDGISYTKTIHVIPLW